MVKSDNGIGAILKRLCEAQPKIFMPNHEGYYRHEDITAMIVAFGVMNASLKQIERLAQDTTIPGEDALFMISDLASESVYQ